MKLFSMITVLTLTLTGTVGAQADELVTQPAEAAQVTEQLTWTQDFEQAKLMAREQQKPIFLYFTGSDWCPWCMRMDKEILSTPAFQQALGNKMIFVKADFPKKTKLDEATQKQNEELKTQFGLRGFPTVIILNSDGEKIATTGYKQGGPAAYVTHIEEILATKK